MIGFASRQQTAERRRRLALFGDEQHDIAGLDR